MSYLLMYVRYYVPVLLGVLYQHFINFDTNCYFGSMNTPSGL
jgi:hypothetical protein